MKQIRQNSDVQEAIGIVISDGAKLEVTPRALAQIAKAGFDPVFGARPLKRAIQKDIENPVSTLILEGRFGPKDVIPVDYENGRFVFERVVH